MGFLGVFELGSLLCGVAVNSSQYQYRYALHVESPQRPRVRANITKLDMLIIGRAVAGLGGAGLINGGITILSACTPLEKRASMKHNMPSIRL